MITPQDIKTGKQKLFLKGMLVGPTGYGKTHLASTFPKCYFAFTEPDGEKTFLGKPQLLKNVVGWDFFIPENPLDTKRVFEEFNKMIEEVRKMAKEGQIETFVLDNLTYFGHNLWAYLDKHFPPITTRNGEKDVQRMYGRLSEHMWEYLYMKILSLPCNIILTVHEKLESDDVMEKKPDKTSPVVPDILGSIRDRAVGMVSFIFFLGKINTGNGQYKYIARTNLGQGKNAKSKFFLPEIIENVNYEVIYKAIMDGLNKETK